MYDGFDRKSVVADREGDRLCRHSVSYEALSQFRICFNIFDCRISYFVMGFVGFAVSSGLDLIDKYHVAFYVFFTFVAPDPVK